MVWFERFLVSPKSTKKEFESEWSDQESGINIGVNFDWTNRIKRQILSYFIPLHCIVHTRRNRTGPCRMRFEESVLFWHNVCQPSNPSWSWCVDCWDVNGWPKKRHTTVFSRGGPVTVRFRFGPSNGLGWAGLVWVTSPHFHEEEIINAL